MEDKAYKIGLNDEGSIVIQTPDDGIITFPVEISKLLYYNMCAFYNNTNDKLNNKHNNQSSTLKIC